MFEDIKKNLKQEKKIVADMASVQIGMQGDSSNHQFYLSSLVSLSQQLYLLNNAVPELLREWSPLKKFSDSSANGKVIPSVVKSVEKPAVVRMSYISPLTKEKRFVTINKADKKAFLEKLKFSEESLMSIQKMKADKSITLVNKPNPYAKFSNKYFSRYSEKLVPRFSSLERDLKRGNIRFLMSTYLSMAIMSSVLAFLFGLMVYGAIIAISLGNVIHAWVPFALSGFTMMGFYFYPASEASSVQKNITQELPFATIYMAAIAGSDIEPTKIFRIIAVSKEYPSIGAEMRKIVTQIEIYGYDLVSALKNVASKTSNRKFSELLAGLATNISSGGALKSYLEKKSENFLLDYKLERQKYTDLAGTFMDVYISILIAAPLVLMMMFIVMNVSGMGVGGFGITTLLFLSIAGIAVANIIFLVVLNIKQPKV